MEGDDQQDPLVDAVRALLDGPHHVGPAIEFAGALSAD